MITAEEALGTVMEHAGRPTTGVVPLSAAAGRVLAEEIRADIDMPPFDRSAMDGFALPGPGRTYDLMAEIAAGDPGPASLSGGSAAPIMTGAPVPPGTDRIVRVEDCTVEGSTLTVAALPPPGANICLRGEDIAAGQVVLEPGTRLAPQHLGIAAMAGRGVVRVYRRPRVSVMTTGSEVVPPAWVPGPGSVRNANLPLMESLLDLAGMPPEATSHAGDRFDSLQATARQMLEAGDVLLAAGGVSMGTRDLVPPVLESLGVTILFRSVAQKPGKPLLFGLDPEGRPVFGLPGNPVSVMVSMEEYVLPMLRRTSGHGAYRKRTFHGVLSAGYRKARGRLHYLRVLAVPESGSWRLHLPESSGSGDLMSVSGANAVALVAAERESVPPGDVLPFHFLSGAAGELAFE